MKQERFKKVVEWDSNLNLEVFYIMFFWFWLVGSSIAIFISFFYDDFYTKVIISSLLIVQIFILVISLLFEGLPKRNVYWVKIKEDKK